MVDRNCGNCALWRPGEIPSRVKEYCDSILVLGECRPASSDEMGQPNVPTWTAVAIGTEGASLWTKDTFLCSEWRAKNA